MTEQQLTEIEAQHKEGRHGWCTGCAFETPWPCDVVDLVAEVRRLRGEIKTTRREAYGICEP